VKRQIITFHVSRNAPVESTTSPASAGGVRPIQPPNLTPAEAVPLRALRLAFCLGQDENQEEVEQ